MPGGVLALLSALRRLSLKAESPETVWFQGFGLCDMARAMGFAMAN